MKPDRNTIFFAPVQEVIKRLDSRQFDLIYIDPPFYSEINSNEDDLPYKTFRDYLEYIIFVIYQSKRLLRDTGSILFRMDPLSPFNSRLFLDRIFGKRNFRAEIIWEFSNRLRISKLPRSNFDSVFFYSQTNEFTYHEPKVNLPDEELRQKYRHQDGKGFYKYWSLFSPVDRPNMEFTWKGITPPKGSSWKYSLERLNELDANGEIEIIKNNARRRVYLTDEALNSPMGFVWKGFTPLRPESTATDFKIQQIIKMASNAHDFVFDPFMLPRSIPSIQSAERNWTGVALIEDDSIYKQAHYKNQEILEIHSLDNLDIVDTVELPNRITTLINAEAAAFEANTSTIYIGQRYAILIGINNYKQGFHSLNYCVNDANKLEKVLIDAGYQTRKLHDEQEDDDLSPLKANILTEIRTIAQNIYPEDTLFVHFSCHGRLIDGNPVLITSDTRSQQLELTCLSLDQVIEAMKCGRAKKLVLSLDVCHAGINTGRAFVEQEFVDNVYNKAEGFALLTASTAHQEAFEPHELEHGLFTYYIIQGLSGEADHDEDGRITVSNLKDFVLQSIRHWSSSRQNRQDPTFRSEGIGEIVLVSPLTS